MKLTRIKILLFILFAFGFSSSCTSRDTPTQLAENQPVLTSPELQVTQTEIPKSPVPSQTLTQVMPVYEYVFPSPSLVLATQTASLTATHTFTPTITPTATEGPSPTFTRRPSSTPTRTSTPEAPFAYLRLTKPGPFSKVISPISFYFLYNQFF